MSEKIHYTFQCPKCGFLIQSYSRENFSEFADRVFISHVWKHLARFTKEVIRQPHMPAKHYTQSYQKE